MKAFRENPDGEENQRMTRENEREVFALKMQALELERDCALARLDECHKMQAILLSRLAGGDK